MAYIAPDSDIYVLKGVPLDSDYNHTLYQSNATAQYNTFYSYRKYTFTDQSYQRAGKGKLRIARLADDLYDCNYLMFRNTAFGNKWFYAFLDKVEYINNNASELYYTIDDMQSWYFDYDLGSCFVEREHTLTDVIGENLVPEDVNMGDYVVEQDWEFKFPTDSPIPQTPSDLDPRLSLYPNCKYCLAVYYENGRENVSIGGIIINPSNYMFQYASVYVSDTQRVLVLNESVLATYVTHIPLLYPDSTYSSVNRQRVINLLKWLETNNCPIVKMVLMPMALYYKYYSGDSYGIDPTGETFEQNSTRAESARFYDTNKTNFYTAKNNKMYTYPYRKLIVSNNNGDTAEYKWEFFATDSLSGKKQANFNIQGTALPMPELMAYPRNYRGISHDYENGIIINNFPEVSWNVDTFAQWWAQNRESFVSGMVSSAISTVGGSMLSNMTNAVNISGMRSEKKIARAQETQNIKNMGTNLNVVSDIGSSLNGYFQAQNSPDQVYGNVSVSTLKTIQNRVGYHFYEIGIERDSAKSIDNYFSMFGYAVKKLKVPNIRQSGVTLRPHWNYVKTKACVIHPATGKGLPSDAESNIASIYDNGITFWTNASEVGDYSLDNSPSA